VTPGKQRQVALLGLDVHQVDVELVAEGADDLLGLVQPQHAVVDEDARELVADGAMQQAATTLESTPPESPQMTRLSPTCSRTADGLLDDVEHRPHRRDAGDVVQEALDDLLAELGVRDLGVELRRVQLAPGPPSPRRRWSRVWR
jgi:hypothetical protein